MLSFGFIFCVRAHERWHFALRVVISVTDLQLTMQG